MSGLFAGTSFERPITCERCEKPFGQCTCPRTTDGKVANPKDHNPRVQREKRGGKIVTAVRGLPLRPDDLKAMLKALRSKMGTGGALTDDGFELQGDHRDKIVELLKAQGYPAKPSGG